MTNKQLFKEAIAEAKSIREAAIINAKEALEETLTPQIKSLLAQRLAEMEEEDIQEEEEMLEQPVVAEAEKEEEEKEASAEEEEEQPSEEEAEGESEDEDIDVASMSVDDLKDLIRDIAAEVSAEMMPGMEQPAGEEAPEDLMGAEMDAEEEEIDLDELLAELSEQPSKKVNLNSVEIEGLDPADRPDYSDAYISYAEYEDGTELTPEEIEQFEQENYGVIHDILMDRGMLEETGVSEAMDPQTIEMIAAALGPLVVGAGAMAINKAMAALKGGKAGEAGKKLAAHLEAGGKAAAGAIDTSKGTYENTEEMEEALKTIDTLKTQLQEVNLLNAKLLYVNKLFKSGRNLSEAQKANIISTFDKASTAKEAQLVYESLKTTITNTTKTAPTKIVESKLGMASKPAGVAPKKTEIITEVSDAVKRMQKLAGIIK